MFIGKYMAFNINAEVVLSGPKNLAKVRKAISTGLQGINTPVNVTVAGGGGLTKLNASITATNANLKALNVASKKSVASVSTYSKASANAAQSTTALSSSAASASKSVRRVGQEVGAAGTQMQAFGKDAALAIRRFSAFTIATGAIFGFARALKDGIGEGIKFERELVKISQVTGKVGSQLDGLTSQIDRLSTTLGVSALDLVDVARTFAQTGQTLDQVESSLKAVARASLSPTFGSMKSTTEGVIAALNQFNIQASKTEEVLGSINAVSKQFAVESEDIVSVIRKAGGVFAASSSQFQKPQAALNDLIAIFTAVRSTTRESADSIGTGLRTIFARLQRPGTVKFLDDLGIQITDTEGKFIGFFDTFKVLSEKLSSLQASGDVITFGAIVEELGGIRQLKNLIPAIVQFEKAEKARTVALQGTASISKDVALAQQTLAVQFENVGTRFQELLRNVSKSDTFQNLAKFALTAANAFITLADALRPALPLLTAFAAVKLTGAAFSFGRGFVGGLGKGGGAGGVGGAVGGAVSGASTQAKQAAIAANTAAQTSNTTQLTALSGRITALIAALNRRSVGGGARRFGSGGGVGRKPFRSGGRVRFNDGGLTTEEQAELKTLRPQGRQGKLRGAKDARYRALLQKSRSNATITSGSIGSTFGASFLEGAPTPLSSTIKSVLANGPAIGRQNLMAAIGNRNIKPGAVLKAPNAKPGFLSQSGRDIFTEEIEGGIVPLFNKATKRFSGVLNPGSVRLNELMSNSAVQNVKGQFFEGFVRRVSQNLVTDPTSDPGFDFANVSNKDDLKKLFGGVFVDPNEFKVRNNSDSRGSILGKAISSSPSSLKLSATAATQAKGRGGVSNSVDALLTPGELVFHPNAVDRLGEQNLDMFNRTGDASGLGRFNSSDVTRIPGSGNSDTVSRALEPGSFVIRKSSSEGSGLDLPRFRGGGSVGGGRKQRFQGGGRVSNLAESAGKAATGLLVLGNLDFSSFGGFVNALAGAAFILPQVTAGFLNRAKQEKVVMAELVRASRQLGSRGAARNDATGRSLRESRIRESRGGVGALDSGQVGRQNARDRRASQLRRIRAQRRTGGVVESDLVGLDRVDRADRAGRKAERASARGGRRGIRNPLKGFGGVKGLGLGAVAALAIGPIADSIKDSFGQTEVGGVKGFASGAGRANAGLIGGATGALSGAALGAGIGSFLGPVGVAAGGALGGLIGGLKGAFEAKINQIKFDSFDKLVKSSQLLGGALDALGDDFDDAGKVREATKASKLLFDQTLATANSLIQLNESSSLAAAALSGIASASPLGALGATFAGDGFKSFANDLSTAFAGDVGFLDKVGTVSSAIDASTGDSAIGGLVARQIKNTFTPGLALLDDIKGIGKFLGFGGEEKDFSQRVSFGRQVQAGQAGAKSLELIRDEDLKRAQDTSGRLLQHIVDNLSSEELLAVANGGEVANKELADLHSNLQNIAALQAGKRLTENLKGIAGDNEELGKVLASIFSTAELAARRELGRGGDFKSASEDFASNLFNSIDSSINDDQKVGKLLNALPEGAFSSIENFVNGVQGLDTAQLNELAKGLGFDTPHSLQLALQSLSRFNSELETALDPKADDNLAKIRLVQESLENLTKSIDALGQAADFLSRAASGATSNLQTRIGNADAETARILGGAGGKISAQGRINPFSNVAASSNADIQAGVNRIGNATGQPGAFRGIPETIQIGRDLPQILKSTLDSLGEDAVNIGPNAIIDEFKKQAGPAFARLPEVVQQDIVSNLQATFAKRQGEGADGQGSVQLKNILQLGDFESLGKTLTKAGEDQAAAAATVIESLNKFDAAIIESANLQLTIAREQAKADESIIKNNQSIRGRLDRFRPSTRDPLARDTTAERNLQQILTAQLSRGGEQAPGNVFNANAILDRRSTLQARRGQIQNDITTAQDRQAGGEDATSELTRLAGELANNTAALDGNQAALDTLSGDVTRLSEIESQLSRIQESRLNERQSAALFAADLAAAEGDPKKQEEILRKRLRPVLAQQAVARGEQIGIGDAAAIAQNPELVARAAKLNPAQSDQLQANVTGGIQNFVGGKLKGLGITTDGAGAQLAGNLFGLGATKQGSTDAEKQGRADIKTIAGGQNAIIQGLVDQNTALMVNQQAQMRAAILQTGEALKAAGLGAANLRGGVGASINNATGLPGFNFAALATNASTSGVTIPKPGAAGAAGAASDLFSPVTNIGRFRELQSLPLNSDISAPLAASKPGAAGAAGSPIAAAEVAAKRMGDGLRNAAAPVAEKLNQAAETLKNLPALTINLDGSVQPVEVILNGGQLLNEISPKITAQVLEQVSVRLKAMAQNGDPSLQQGK